MVKAHPASVKVIPLLFSDRENLFLLTLDGHRLHGKSRPSLFALREMRRASATVCSFWACVLHLLCGRRCRSKIRVLVVYESWTSQCGGQCGQIVTF